MSGIKVALRAEDVPGMLTSMGWARSGLILLLGGAADPNKKEC